MAATITDMLVSAKQRPTSITAAKFKSKGRWKNTSWQELFSLCEFIGLALIELGLKKGDRVGIFCNTRLEWEIIDLASLGMGLVTVPIYQSSLPEDIEFIVNDSQIKVLVCEDLNLYGKWKSIAHKTPSIEKLVLIEGELKKSDTSVLPWDQLIFVGKQKAKENAGLFEKNCASNQASDLATIVYTSGTTGNPKGVVLSHLQISSEIIELFDLLHVNEKDIALTFLPFAHILGRVEMWGSIYKGYTLAFAESIDKIKYNLEEVKPTIIIAVPRIFEKIYNGILSQIATSKVKQKLFSWALKIGTRISHSKLNKEAISLSDIAQYALAKKLIFSKIKNKMGGRLRFAFSGGAPLSQTIAEFFHAADLLILEGYGLTETTAGICLNTPLEYKFGTVGKPLGDVQIKIAEDGEILVKSDKVMVEYYQNESATKEVFVDGFFATGDIGQLDKDGFLKITDRKKDLIKSAGGKYIAPQRLENLLKLNPFISNVLIHGDQRKYVVALVTLDEANVTKYASDHEISFSDFDSLIKNEEIRQIIYEAIAEANSHLASYETIKNFDILQNDFTIESGELTPSLKVKRKVCDTRYADKLDKLYGTDNSSL